MRPEAGKPILNKFKDVFKSVAETGRTYKKRNRGQPLSPHPGEWGLMSKLTGENEMSENWEQKALAIGDSLHEAALEYPELVPLCTSWRNFARKRHLPRLADNADSLSTLLERYGLTIIPKDDIDRHRVTIASQAEEIKALQYRIATLLRP